MNGSISLDSATETMSFRNVFSAMNNDGLRNALREVNERVKAATANRLGQLQQEVRVVAVSKTKPVQDVMAAYECGQRHFGENYVQELLQKAKSPEIVDKCPDIRWHFIGHLQRNKVPKVVSIPNLFMVETVDSEKLAMGLDSACATAKRQQRLNVLIQVNTSEEAEKSGVNPRDAKVVARFIRDKCPNLDLRGLMTIGRFDHDPANGPNPDFQLLHGCRLEVCAELECEEKDLELSMGMSDDYEHAIELGSTNVRIGSLIFGKRDYPPK